MFLHEVCYLNVAGAPWKHLGLLWFLSVLGLKPHSLGFDRKSWNKNIILCKAPRVRV